MNRDADANEAGRLSQADLAEGYRQMAVDRDQEIKAEEWTEALVGDVALDEGSKPQCLWEFSRRH
jgi:hypothetical protein